MVQKIKERDAEEQARAKRTQLPRPMDIPQEESDEEAQPIQEFQFTLDHFSKDCFVDTALMIAEEACVARGTFKDAQGRQVLVHVPTRSFFNLHTINPNAPYIWSKSMSGGVFHTSSMGA